VTADEYQCICGRLARKAIRYAVAMVAEEEPTGDLDAQREHWIDVYLDTRLPNIDADVLLGVTRNADAFEKTGRSPGSREVAAFHAFQADVWDAINQTKAPP
jgi:hypothetical protein